jgi:hypothetical protein
MRFVPTINPPTATPTTRAVKGLTGIHVVKHVHEEVEPTSVTLSTEARQRQGSRQQLPDEERRKTCRRLNIQKVPVELRTGDDRRQVNLLEGGIAEHIDEEA